MDETLSDTHAAMRCCPTKHVFVDAIDYRDAVNNQQVHQKPTRGAAGHAIGIQLDNRETVRQSLESMLATMAVFGIYFDRRLNPAANTRYSSAARRMRTKVLDHCDTITDEVSYHGSIGHHPVCRYYAVTVLIILWANFIRFFTIFTGSPSLESNVLGKLVTLFWFGMVAINHLSMYYACHFGLPNILFRRINVKDAGKARRKVRVQTAVAVTLIVMTVAYYAYWFYSTHLDDSFDYYVSPFDTLISLDSWQMLAVKGVVLFCGVFVMSSWILTIMLAHAVAANLSEQFFEIDEQFRKSIDISGTFRGSIGAFRRRHQAVCHDVKRADRFIRISNVAGFCSNMACVVIFLYNVIFVRTKTMPIVRSCLFMLANAAGLAMTTADGVLVNYAVSFNVTVISVCLVESIGLLKYR